MVTNQGFLQSDTDLDQEGEIMQPEFILWDAYWECMKILLLLLLLFISVAAPVCIIRWVVITVIDKWNRTKKWHYRGE